MRVSEHLIPDGNDIDLGSASRPFRQIFAGAAGLAVVGGPLLVPAGSVSAPSISFSGDPNTGFLNSAANQVQLSVNGDVKFEWGNDNVFGIHATGSIAWTDTASNPTATRDTFLSRGAAGAVILTNDGATTGTATLGKAAVGLKGLYADYTNSGTIGAVTISKMAGRANIAAGASSVVVTNTLCTAASKVFASLVANDVTALYIRSVIPGAGSFTIATTANATANTAVDWFLLNTD